MPKQTIDAWLDGRDRKRCKAEDRAIAAEDRKRGEAEKMVGQLASGAFYIFPVGGKYRTGPKHELIDFLIRNRYV